MRDHVYLDSAALVKLVVLEPESAALRKFLIGHPTRLSSGLVEVEVPRALRRAGYGVAEQRRAVELVARIALVDVARFSAPPPRSLRPIFGASTRSIWPLRCPSARIWPGS